MKIIETKRLLLREFTIADLAHLEEILSKRGYGTKDIAAILHDNWLELLRRAWG